MALFLLATKPRQSHRMHGEESEEYDDLNQSTLIKEYVSEQVDASLSLV